MGQSIAGRPAAGPAIMISFIVVAIACAFARSVIPSWRR